MKYNVFTYGEPFDFTNASNKRMAYPNSYPIIPFGKVIKIVLHIDGGAVVVVFSINRRPNIFLLVKIPEYWYLWRGCQKL